MEKIVEWVEDLIKKGVPFENLQSQVNHMNSNLFMVIPSNNNTFDEKLEFIQELYNQLKDDKPKEKENLTIVFADDSSSLEYVEYLSTDFNVTVVKQNDVKSKRDIDLIVFTGGEDVNPQYYGEQLGKYTHINSNRDNKEVDCFNRFRNVVPMLGICRGNQLLTVLNGGKLIQHVEGHGSTHTIKDFKGGTYKMTSTHHQMVYPFNLSKDSYTLIAYSEFFKSTTYLNGDNEEIKLDKDFLEPEIVFYPNTKCLGIQGHPEYGSCPDETKRYCMRLIKKYLLNSKDKSEDSISQYDRSFNDDFEPSPISKSTYKYIKDSMEKLYFTNSPQVIKSRKSDSNIGIPKSWYEPISNDLSDYYHNTGVDINSKQIDKNED